MTTQPDAELLNLLDAAVDLLDREAAMRVMNRLVQRFAKEGYEQDYGTCPVCGKPMVFEAGESVDLHSMPDGSDCHAECCPTCEVRDG